MNDRGLVSDFAAGLVVGAAVGVLVGLLYAPEHGEESREAFKQRLNGITGPIRRLLFNLKWMSMSPRDRYVYLWSHGGSLHDWSPKYDLPEHI